ncbi:hypothetical protein HanRHA438_Chr01g0027311 [Helianthus annuus]|uniref:Uncharacterized protein n=1 Tax=Helianthus annuus TaxID=4232 RepID=A0A251VPD2_HELAN|nr:hypothetical protein HanRHA438_Chr01g0027311 [Helianthus annuus]KAJ0957335.1 hypothetical protein HanPSC8_Chr01g0026061 [Helianthus annuus]
MVCLFVSASPYRAFQVRVGQLTRSTSLCIHRITLDFGSPSTTVDLSQPDRLQKPLPVTLQTKGVMNKRSIRKEELLEAEVKRLREELNKANLEKSEINSEYEKLTTICRSQRQQLHTIKQALSSFTTPGIQQQGPGLFNKSSTSPDHSSWQAFPEDHNSTPVGTTNSHQNRSVAARSPVTSPVINLNQSQRFGGLESNERNMTSQPPGWAAF